MKLSNSQREAILAAYESFLSANKKDNPDPDNGGGYFHEYLFDFLFRALKILEVVPSSEEYDNEVARELDYYGCGGAPDCDYCLDAEKEQS